MPRAYFGLRALMCDMSRCLCQCPGTLYLEILGLLRTLMAPIPQRQPLERTLHKPSPEMVPSSIRPVPLPLPLFFHTLAMYMDISFEELIPSEMLWMDVLFFPHLRLRKQPARTPVRPTILVHISPAHATFCTRTNRTRDPLRRSPLPSPP